MADEEKQATDTQAAPAATRRELADENARLKDELAKLQTAVVAEKGPAQGTPVCYQKHGESFCRPATIASEGFTERVKRNSGVELHALIEYAEPPWVQHESPKGDTFTPPHSFQTDRAWNPLGLDETWHLPEECPRAGTKGCPYGRAPHYLGVAKVIQTP